MQEKSLEQLYTLDITLANTNWQSVQHGDFCGRPLVWFWVYNKHSLFHCHLQHFRHTFWALWGIKICQISQVYCVTYVGHIPIHNMNGKLSQINDTMYIWYGNDIQGCLALYSTPWLPPFKLRGWFAGLRPTDPYWPLCLQIHSPDVDDNCCGTIQQVAPHTHSWPGKQTGAW